MELPVTRFPRVEVDGAARAVDRRPCGGASSDGPNSSRRTACLDDGLWPQRPSSVLPGHGLEGAAVHDGDEPVRCPGQPDVEQRFEVRHQAAVEVGHDDRRRLQALERVDGAVLNLPRARGVAGQRAAAPAAATGSVVTCAAEPELSGLRTVISFSANPSARSVLMAWTSWGDWSSPAVYGMKAGLAPSSCRRNRCVARAPGR